MSAVVALEDVRYVVDENLLSLGNGMVALRRDTARFSCAPVDELLPVGISDPQWIPIVGDHGLVITDDRRLRTRPGEATLAIQHKLKVIHLHGDVGNKPAWAQMVRIATRWTSIENHVNRGRLRGRGGYQCVKVYRLMRFMPGSAERA